MSKYGPTVWPDDTPAPADGRSEPDILQLAVQEAYDNGYYPANEDCHNQLMEILKKHLDIEYRRRELESRIAEAKDILQNISSLGVEVYFAVERIKGHIEILQAELDKLTEGRGE